MEIRRRPVGSGVNTGEVLYQVALPDAEPRNILEKIVWQKEKEVERLRERLPLPDLRRRVQQSAPPVRDFLGALQAGKTQPALIAELKKASPSKGTIRADFDPVAIAQTYERSRASCLSVLTDEQFFQGSFENLIAARQATALPVLCKDFLIYPYQIMWARLHGADAVLLIAAVLNDKDLSYFVKIARSLHLTPLIEVHTLDELDRVLGVDGVTLVGINNRNLEDFSVDVATTRDLLLARGKQLRERGIAIVSESGLHVAADVQVVRRAGADAVLIGESLLAAPDSARHIASLFGL
ncbi:Indole-3-glycerol phosphate synthase [Rubidibacter lacunae KORDI 51-2]|uniref:Indole-3-glycerol phosphate synthase n=1 Tax=Rubidibacter lacunae KORDI 51-2 TaxID=582515 RepID=U5DMF0_9CHRO|nr:indole-3-glycerol phosphate synthase TrpC [Rubidibacter lacunae]ERN41774.1 Indole-3-glycerol phosphate synthase [Rubidibacter lacunae KORDI 51-2]